MLGWLLAILLTQPQSDHAVTVQMRQHPSTLVLLDSDAVTAQDAFAIAPFLLEDDKLFASPSLSSYRVHAALAGARHRAGHRSDHSGRRRRHGVCGFQASPPPRAAPRAGHRHRPRRPGGRSVPDARLMSPRGGNVFRTACCGPAACLLWAVRSACGRIARSERFVSGARLLLCPAGRRRLRRDRDRGTPSRQ